MVQAEKIGKLEQSRMVVSRIMEKLFEVNARFELDSVWEPSYFGTNKRWSYTIYRTDTYFRCVLGKIYFGEDTCPDYEIQLKNINDIKFFNYCFPDKMASKL